MVSFAALIATLQTGPPQIPAANMFMTDEEIDAAVTAARTSHLSEESFDGLWLVRTANKLQPLGREKGLSLLFEMDSRRVNVGDKIGRDIYWLVNVLFEVPKGKTIPPPDIPGLFEGPKEFVRWPLFLELDVPMLLGQTQGWEGNPKMESVRDYALRLAATFEWRSSLLSPVKDPFTVYERLYATDAYFKVSRDRRSGDLDRELARQLGRLVRTVYKPEFHTNNMSGLQVMSLFKNQFRNVRAIWDSKIQDYRIRDNNKSPR